MLYDRGIVKKNPEEDFLKLQDLWGIFISKWYWFAISFAFSLFLAFLYLAVTPNVYTRSASIVIKDDSKSASSIGGADLFADMGLFKSKTNIQNELLTIQAPILMEEVVEMLDLDESYSVKDWLRRKDLYRQSPVIVMLDKANPYQTLSFTINLLPNDGVKLSQFVIDENDADPNSILANSEGRVVGKLSDTIYTPIGKVVVYPTNYYNKYNMDVPILFSKIKTKLAASRYSSDLKVTLGNKDATVVNLSIEDVSPQRAEDILNAMIAFYNKNWIKDKNQVTVSTSQFINERLGVIEEELGSVDENISTFKSRNLLPDVQAVSEKYLARSNENDSKILALNTQLAMARYIRNYLNDAATKNQLLPANSGVDNTKVETQIAEYNSLLLQRNNLFANSSEKNPLVIDMNQSLASMKQVIIRSIDDWLAILKIQIDNINTSEIQTKAKIASNPNQVKYLLSVERQQKIKEALYLFLLQKREENELSQAFTAYNTKVINPPEGKSTPTAPKKNAIILIAMALGLMLPAIVIILVNKLNTMVRGRKDLNTLTIPFLGEIPLVIDKNGKWFFRKKEQPKITIVIEEKNRNYINEAFRIIRTNIDFMCKKSDRGIVIMQTSLYPDNGKTFISINLAICMAIKGAKVIVVDLDLRKASLSTCVNSPKIGISDYLGRNTDNLDRIIVKKQIHPNLDIIPVGILPPNPSELLLRNRFNEMINKLRSEYDYIFLDCPPMELVTDATIISKVCDLTLFIIRVGMMDNRLLPDIENIFTCKKFNNMGIILNGSSYNMGKYRYNRYGYQKYGYEGDVIMVNNQKVVNA